MPSWLFILLPSLCMLAPCAGIFFYLKRLEREDRKSPLVDDLQRLPGETLNEHLRDSIFELCAAFAASILFPAVGLLTLLSSWVAPERVRFSFTAVFSIVLVLGGVSWAFRRTLRILHTITTTKRGLEGELATAQLLAPLLAEGWQVFHDLPMKRGNIDHVLVGHTGVYAIETKYRSKRLSLKGKESAQAEYDGRSIRFAGGASEHLPVQQAQAVAGEMVARQGGRSGKRSSSRGITWLVRENHEKAGQWPGLRDQSQGPLPVPQAPRPNAGSPASPHLGCP